MSRQLSIAERESITPVDCLAAPDLAGIAAITTRLTELETKQRALKSRITDLTLQIRDRRDQNLSLDEIRDAFQNFCFTRKGLDFDARQYASRLLVKQMPVELRNFRSQKLRNHDVRHA